MDSMSVLLVIKLVSEGIGVAKEIADLARRVRDGGVITDAEIAIASKAIKDAIADWENS